jgi:N-methylhydantoinase A
VPVPSPVTNVGDLVAAFHAQHEREYNFRRDTAPVDLYRLNLQAIGIVPKAALAEYEPGDVTAPPCGHRDAWFGRPEPYETAIYWRPDLSAGAKIEGPAIIEQLDSTVLVPPGTLAEIDRFLNVVMRVERA